jgi:hypothetical protein
VSDQVARQQPGGWFPLVYGRTFSADLWWRAVPPEVTRTGREGAVVLATVGGGRGLNDGPRFALLRRPGRTLVGVACPAARISDDMNSDGSRPLFCFVGWFSTSRDPRVPSFAHIQEHWKDWAAPEYERWMKPAWTAHQSKLRDPAPTSSERAPWERDGNLPDTPLLVAAVAREVLPQTPGCIRVHPSAEADLIWQAVARTTGSASLVTGWASYRDGIREGLTDVTADDVRGSAPLAVPLPQRSTLGRPQRVPSDPSRRAGVDQSRKSKVTEVSPAASTNPVQRQDQRATPVEEQDSGSPLQIGRDLLRHGRNLFGGVSRVLHMSSGQPSTSYRLPPLPSAAPEQWRQGDRPHVQYSECDGIRFGWDGERLWRWTGEQWVRQDPPSGPGPASPSAPTSKAAASTPGSPPSVRPGPVPPTRAASTSASRASAIVPPPSAKEISQRIGSTFDAFENRPVAQAQPAQPADDQCRLPCDPSKESKDGSPEPTDSEA